jgi:hypothetical protein
VTRPSSVEKVMSVKVPPTSTPMRIPSGDARPT